MLQPVYQHLFQWHVYDFNISKVLIISMNKINSISGVALNPPKTLTAEKHLQCMSVWADTSSDHLNNSIEKKKDFQNKKDTTLHKYRPKIVHTNVSIIQNVRNVPVRQQCTKK